MNFIVVENIKKELEKQIVSQKRHLRVIRFLEKMNLLISLVGGFGYIILNILISGASMVRIRGEVKKDYFSIFLFGTLIIAGFLTSWILIRTLRIRLSQIGISDRVDESLSITDDYLIYIYRLKFESLPCDRGVVAVKLDEISSVTYDADIRKLVIYGALFDDWIENFRSIRGMDFSKTENSMVEIYDYFTPSLLKELKNHSVRIVQKEENKVKM